MAGIIVKGTCFYFSLYKGRENVELLSIMVKDTEDKTWKFNLGDWTNILNKREDIFKLMTAEYLHIRSLSDEGNIISSICFH